MTKIDEKEIIRRFEAISRFKPDQDVVACDLERVRQRLTEQSGTQKQQQNIWRVIMLSKITKLAAAAVIVLVVMLGLHGLVGDGTGLAFGQILEKLRSVQTLHATLHNWNGKDVEVWAKRPNMVRLDYSDGTYEISNGPIMWVVDESNDEATRKPSWYFQHAQRHGLDVLDFLFQASFTDDFSGFFSEGPVEQIKQNGKVFDLYQMQTTSSGRTWEFEALVDAETHFVHSMTFEIREQDQVIQSNKLSVLEYDQPVPEKMFVFEPPRTMDVSVEGPDAPEPEPEQIEGSTLSGRITWASSGKPVVEARLTVDLPVYGPNGRRQPSLSFNVRAETNREGYWQVNGVPGGEVDIRVRSWELEWPAVPTFTTYVRSPRNPHITVDGQSDYGGLDFKVYKPEDLYSRITVRVTDEDGNPVEGARGSIGYDDPNGGHMHQHLYARPHQQHTGPGGTFDARDIWPSTRPVRVSAGAGSRYVRRGVQTDPFVIKAKESYHFDFVLQRAVQMKIQVVDPQNKPLEGVVVKALDTQWWFVHVDGPERFLFTDSNGLVEVDGMDPAEDVIIAVRRMEPKVERPRKTFASLFVPAVAPSGRDKPTRRIVFDERPISIEGTYDKTFAGQKHTVYVMPAGLPRYRGTPFAFLMARVDDAGRFLLQGVPAGDILLVCKDWASDRTVAEQTIRTEPGKTYTVKVSSRGLELIGHKPSF
jgi:outer membrane lipoprotein-sorting protein